MAGEKEGTLNSTISPEKTSACDEGFPVFDYWRVIYVFFIFPIKNGVPVGATN